MADTINTILTTATEKHGHKNDAGLSALASQLVLRRTFLGILDSISIGQGLACSKFVLSLPQLRLLHYLIQRSRRWTKASLSWESCCRCGHRGCELVVLLYEQHQAYRRHRHQPSPTVSPPICGTTLSNAALLTSILQESYRVAC